MHSLDDRSSKLNVSAYDFCDLVRCSDHRPVSLVASLEVNAAVIFPSNFAQPLSAAESQRLALPAVLTLASGKEERVVRQVVGEGACISSPFFFFSPPLFLLSSPQNYHHKKNPLAFSLSPPHAAGEFYLFELSITELSVELNDGDIEEDEDRDRPEQPSRGNKSEETEPRTDARRPSAAQQASTPNPLCEEAARGEGERTDRDSIPSALGADAHTGSESSAKHPLKAFNHSQLGRIKVCPFPPFPFFSFSFFLAPIMF